jgi:hypothetical protein
MKIVFKIKNISLQAELYNTKTAKAVYDVLPLEADIEEWGDEFYFETPVQMPLDETATSRIKIGDIGYWPPGNAIAIFFGPTPISKGNDPVPASDVNLIGKIIGDATILRELKGARKIRIDKA